MEPQEADRLIRQLTAMAAAQRAITDDLRTSITELRALNRQQTDLNAQQAAIHADIRTTLARVDTLLARGRRQDEANGRDT
jgi:hypothetical protein